MDDSQTVTAITTEGRLCIWRVFELGRDYNDRPKDGSGTVEFSAPLERDSDSDQLKITVGPFPEIIRQALREVRARGQYLLNDVFVGAHQGRMMQEREETIEALHAETNLDDLNINNGLYLVLEISRPMTVKVHPDFRFLWSHGGDQLDPQVFESLAEESRRRLDATLGWLLPVLDPRLSLRRVVVSDNRAILVVPGKAALRPPRIIGSAVAGVVSSESWADQDWQELKQRTAAFANRPTSIDSLVTAPSRWLALALAENDSLRRFLFAFFGLEILANKFISRSRDSLLGFLSDHMPGVSVDELLWPRMPDENGPQRNLVFAFAAMSTLACTESAMEDTQHFRQLTKARNALAHGDADDLGALPSSEAVTLLAKYIKAVVTRNA